MSTTNFNAFRTFSAKDFIDQKTAAVSANSTLSAALSSRQLEPKPLIKTLESSLDDLLRLRRKVQTKIEDLEDAAQASENARRRKLTEMNSAVEDVQSAFKSLELHLGEVGKTAIRIGEQLETIDKQRRIASEAKDLIYYFQDFNVRREGDEVALEKLRKAGSETEAQTATVMRRLNAISKEMGIPGTEMAKENIERFSEELETNILDQFHAAYVKGEKDRMNRCAKILGDLNGGSSCVQTYINQHEFFINQAKVAADSLGSEPGNQVDKNGSVILNPKLMRLFEEVRTTIPQEWEIIAAVFPNSVSVMQNFVQRVFAQSIQNYIEQELTAADAVSDLHYLRILTIVHEAALSLCRHLRKFNKDVIAVQTKTAGIAPIVDRCFDDLFVPYTDNDRYVQVERRCLGARVSGLLSDLNTFLENWKKAAKAKATTNPAMQVVGNLLMGLDGTSGKAKTSADSVNATPEASGIPSVALTLKMLEIHLEALRRCKELSKQGDLPRNVLTVYKELIGYAGQRYLLISLDLVAENITTLDGKTEPHFHNLEVVRVENAILNLFQMHFQTSILPLMSLSPTIHRDAVITKNEFMEAVETRINAIIKTHVDAIQEWLEIILSKQKRSDYRPRDDNMASYSTSTPTCAQVCEFLDTIHLNAEKYFEGINLTGFLSEVGSIFHMLLLEHMKKFTFSDVGGLILARDLAKYFEVVSSFRIENLTNKFEMIRELGNLYLAKPENLQQVINGGHLSRIDVTLLTPFLKCRVDWSKLEKLGIFFTNTSI
ncbi:exocyst complex component Sec10-like protein [Chytriomyces cf. hyalinus JEL632]|nr:exocyst complex component Sec10-like protein [Chytriomyces cf. hyalinus JEL632]